MCGKNCAHAKAKEVDTRIDKAYKIAGDRAVIGLFDIPKVFAVGRELCKNGASDEALVTGLKTFIDGIKHR